MAVTPAQLKRITTNPFPTLKLKARPRVNDRRPRYMPQDIRLTPANRAGTSLAQELQPKIGLSSVAPSNRELIADALDI